MERLPAQHLRRGLRRHRAKRRRHEAILPKIYNDEINHIDDSKQRTETSEEDSSPMPPEIVINENELIFDLPGNRIDNILNEGQNQQRLHAVRGDAQQQCAERGTTAGAHHPECASLVHWCLIFTLTVQSQTFSVRVHAPPPRKAIIFDIQNRSSI